MDENTKTGPVSIFIADATDTGFNLVSVIDSYETLIFEQSFAGVGKFSFTVLADSMQSNYVKINRYIIVGQSYGMPQARVGIIQTIDDSITSDHKHVLRVEGMEAKGVFSWRINLPNSGYAYFTASGTAEAVFKNVAAYQGGPSSASSARKIAGLTIAASLNRGASYVYSERYTNVAQVFERLSLAAGMGWAVKWNATGLLFDVIVGADRTIGNGVFPPALLSIATDTASNSRYVSSEASYKNYTYVGGQGVGSERTIRTAYTGAGEPKGVNRKEFFTDARDLSATADLDSRAASVLAENGYTRYIEADVNPYSLFYISSGATLGDTITIESSGVQQNCQITGVTEEWGSDGYRITLALDKEPATLATAIQSTRYAGEKLAGNAEGTVIESGSNANGYYRKLSDGTLEQWGSVAGPTLSYDSSGAYANYTGAVTITYAYDPLPGPPVYQTVNTRRVSAGSYGSSCSIYNISNSSFGVRETSPSNQASSAIVWHAIGRWK